MRALAALLAALAGCAAPGAEVAADPPGTASAGLGGTAWLGELTVRPIALVEDSRCPRDAECVWAGRVRILAIVSTLPGQTELVLGQPRAMPGGPSLVLVAVAPERRQHPPAGTNPRAPYRFTFALMQPDLRE